MNRFGRPPSLLRAAILCVGVGLAACSSETVGRPPPAPVAWTSLAARPALQADPNLLTAKERRLADAYCAAVASPGFVQLAPLLEEDAHFASPGLEEAHGREQVARAHSTLFGAFDERKMTPTRVWRTPAVQTVEWTFSGVDQRDWMGISGARKAVTFTGATLLWTKDDGRIADIHVYFDVAVAKARLGAGPKGLIAPAAPAPATDPAQVFDWTPTSSAAENANVAVAKAAVDALEESDAAAYAGVMADDVEIYTPERASRARGKVDAKAYYSRLHRAIGQLDTTVTNAWGIAQFAIVEYSVAGEQIGPIEWIPTRRDDVIRLDRVDICEIRDDRIARIWRYDNPSQILTRAP